MSRDFVIETDRLEKRYGAFEAVAGISLRVRPACITGFLGRNGAGKSSTIRMLLGMIAPSGGTGRVLGHRIDDPRESVALRRQIAYVGEDKGLYAYMTVAEMIRFTRSFYADWREDVAQALLREFNLPPGRNVKALSKGMRTKLALLLALARRPALMILDEPTEGLDPVSIEELLQTLVRYCADGTSIFFSSHQLTDVERVADHIIMIDRGHLVLETSLDDLREHYRTLQVGFAEPPQLDRLQLAGVERVRISGRQATLLVNADAEGVARRMQSAGAVSLDISPVTLREVFLHKVATP